MTAPIPLLLPFFLLFSLALLFSSCSSNRAIAHGLDEKEANEIIVVLESRGINASKNVEESAGGGGAQEITWVIMVPDEDSTKALSILNQLGLPRRRGQNLLKIFSNTGLVPSERQEEIRYQEGLAESIASSIRKMDGVLDADVRLSFPKEDPLNPNKKTQERINASVYVKHSGALDDPNSLMIPRIKRLVAGSVVGLDYENVTVIPDRARYAESSLRDLDSQLDEKEYVSIWSVIVAKESVNRFRILFFSFTISILILLILILWIIWKISPIIGNRGGLKSLFQVAALEPVSAPAKQEIKEEETSEESEEDEEESADREPEETT
jgi:type III secretion protein J